MLKTFTAVKEPRMSAKMLCEYAEASALTRARIIRDCKFKKPFITSRYNLAEEYASEFLSKAIDYPESLKYRAADLKKQSKTLLGYKEEHVMSCSYALEMLYNMNDKLRVLKPFVLRVEENNSRKMKLKEVQVSIRPELMLCDEGGLSFCGFIKLYFGKTTPLSKTVAESMASLGKYCFKEKEGLDFKNKLCFVIDVCAGEIYTAPTTFKRNISQLEACCSEIKDRWDKI